MSTPQSGPDDCTAPNDPAVVSPGGGDGTNALRAEASMGTPNPARTVEQALKRHEWWRAGNLGVPGMVDATTYKCLCGWSGDEPREHQSAAVLDALAAAGFAPVDRATLDQLRDCYGDEFADGLASLPTTKEEDP